MKVKELMERLGEFPEDADMALVTDTIITNVH